MTEQPHERFLTRHEPADTILAEALNRSRVIDDPHDLAQLRTGAVVIDDESAVLEKFDPNLWRSTGEATEYEDDDVDLPAVVIYEPEETPNV